MLETVLVLVAEAAQTKPCDEFVNGQVDPGPTCFQLLGLDPPFAGSRMSGSASQSVQSIHDSPWLAALRFTFLLNGMIETWTSPSTVAAFLKSVRRLLVADLRASILPSDDIEPVVSRASATRS